MLFLGGDGERWGLVKEKRGLLVLKQRNFSRSAHSFVPKILIKLPESCKIGAILLTKLLYRCYDEASGASLYVLTGRLGLLPVVQYYPPSTKRS